jgi:hypothetical protein
MLGSDPNKEALRRRLQTDLVMLEADLKKKMRKMEEIEAEKKNIKKNLAAFEMAYAVKVRDQKKAEQEQFVLNNEIISLKKKINTL